MNLTAQNWAALMPLLIPAAAACLIPIASLDKDQDTVKPVRAAMFGMALLALGVSFFYFTKVWATGQNVFFSHLKMDRLGQFSGIFVTVAAMMALLQLWDHLHHEGWMKGETLSLLLFSAVGMMLFASTTNLLMMFLGLELLSIPLYVLTATVRFRQESVEGGMKYFITGAVASSCFLMGTVLLYGLTGTLELDGIGGAMIATGADPLILVGAALLLMGFLFKISAVPFHQWTPDAYEASPHPIAGFMSVATKGVAVIALMRAFPGGIGLHTVTGQRVGMALAVLAAATMIIGNLSALPQTNVKRMLAYSSISHAGYLLLGFVAGTPEAYIGVLFYLVIYLAMNMAAFGMLTAYGLVGEHTQFEDLRGLGWKRPALGVAVVITMLSLAGIPPMGGFFGKYFIFKELVKTDHVGLAVLGVTMSLVSVYYYLRVVVALFLEQPSDTQVRAASEKPEVQTFLSATTVLICAAIILAGGFFQRFLVDDFAARALKEGIEILR